MDKFKPGDIVIEHWWFERGEGRRLGVIIWHGSGVAIRWFDGADAVIVMTVGALTKLYDRADYD